MTVEELFDLEHTEAREYLQSFSHPWEAFRGLKEFILSLGERLSKTEYERIAPAVWVHRTAKVAPTAFLGEGCIVGAETEIRHCAFVRGSALIGKGCVVGNSTELKNSVLFDGAAAPHYNYVGDSILGYKAHMGAGSITSNLKSDKTEIVIRGGEREIATGLKKMGALVGDFAEVGCNSVLNPGTVVGKHTNIYPLSSVRGWIPSYSIYKSGGVVVAKR